MNRSVTDQWGQGRATVLELLRVNHLEPIPANSSHVELLLERAALNMTPGLMSNRWRAGSDEPTRCRHRRVRHLRSPSGGGG